MVVIKLIFTFSAVITITITTTTTISIVIMKLNIMYYAVFIITSWLRSWSRARYYCDYDRNYNVDRDKRCDQA